MKTDLSKDQLDAAVEIRSQLSTWVDADAALMLVKRSAPGFTQPESLLKVVTVNALYGTNVYAVHPMAAHIARVMRGRKGAHGTELVEEIACLPVPKGGTKRRFYSFASKFCHFYIDHETFPIFDTWAQWTIRHHLGRKRDRDTDHPYRAFVANVQRLKAEANLTASLKEIDSYLWLRGGYARLKKAPDSPVNRNVAAFFAHKANRPLIRRLGGE